MQTAGLTLIELLIVIAIIGILAAVMLPNLVGAQKRAYDIGAQNCARSIQTIQATWRAEKATYASRAQLVGYDDVTSQCSDSNMNVTEASSPTPLEFNITVGDTRGTKTFTVDPIRVTFTNMPPTSPLPL